MIEMTGYRYDANDDMAPVMDAVLKRLSFGVTYGKDDDGEWVSRVNHLDMEDALRDMSPKEQAVIKMFFLERKSPLDISEDLNMPLDLVGGYIKSAKARIMMWM